MFKRLSVILLTTVLGFSTAAFAKDLTVSADDIIGNQDYLYYEHHVVTGDPRVLPGQIQRDVIYSGVETSAINQILTTIQSEFSNVAPNTASFYITLGYVKKGTSNAIIPANCRNLQLNERLHVLLTEANGCKLQ